MALPVTDIRSRIEQANLAAKEFSNLYHEAVDKRRQAIGKIYCEDANMVWNGHHVSGQENIVKFFVALPVSNHFIEGMDTQPLVSGEGMMDPSKASIVVNFAGKVRFTDNGFKAFTQSVILKVQDTKWKIVSDVFRFVE